jgi:hypothetical protein
MLDKVAGIICHFCRDMFEISMLDKVAGIICHFCRYMFEIGNQHSRLREQKSMGTMIGGNCAKTWNRVEITLAAGK